MGAWYYGVGGNSIEGEDEEVSAEYLHPGRPGHGTYV